MSRFFVSKKFFEKNVTSNDSNITGLVRYIKLEILESWGDTYIQFSELKFIDQNSTSFNFPSNTTYTSNISNFGSYGAESPLAALDNSTSTKCCGFPIDYGDYIIYDLQTSCLDLTKYNRWQWYTANDTAEYNTRNLKNFNLYASNDNINWTLIDTATNVPSIAQNYVLAYTGNIDISQFNGNENEDNEDNLSKSNILIGKRVTKINTSDKPYFSTIKKFIETPVIVSFDSQGGSSVENVKYILGKTYSSLPTPTKSQNIFLGWFTSVTGGTQITSESTVSIDIKHLYAHWEEIQIIFDCTSYEVITTSSYKKTGIYVGEAYNSSAYTYIDWGDGSVEKVLGGISQKTHTYSSVGTFTVKISNNLTSFAPSGNNSSWYGTTSHNRYTFKRMLTTGSKVISLPTYAFYYCQAMVNLDFMSTCWTSVTSIPSYCFYYCSGLTSIQGIRRFTSLGSYSLNQCSGLSGVQNLSTFSFKKISGIGTFANCSNITQWILPSQFTATSFGNYTFLNNSNLTTISLPESLKDISSYCFQGCKSLKAITIPKNVKIINDYAFSGCSKLAKVNYETTVLTMIGDYAFYYNSSLESLEIPDSVSKIGNYAFYGCGNVLATSLNLPSALTSIGTDAYCYCYNLKNLSIPSALTSISGYAFSGCRNLSGIVDYRLTAQTTHDKTFGSENGTSNTAYTGYSNRGNNNLSIYFDATGYDESYWLDPLQNPDKCGFNIVYIDPENIKYCTVTFDAGNGSVSESTLTTMQTKKYGTLPIPACPSDQPYFGGWFTGENGTGEKVTANSTVPSQDTITLYALYSATPFSSYIVDLNNQWRESSVANPDSSLYDGVYESYSNYNVNNGWAKMKINITGYTDFTIYIRSYAESSYDYTLAFNLDVEPTSNPSYSTSGVKAHTGGNQQSGTAISNYTKVEYTGIDGGEHFICVVYRKDSSVNSGNDRGYVLIEQTLPPISITFDIGNGILVSGNLTANSYQGKALGSLLPTVTGNETTPYLAGWYDTNDGNGTLYTPESLLPASSSLTLYAIYSDIAPYTPVSYVSGNGAIINTNHYPTLNTSMEFEMMPIEYTGENYIGFELSQTDNNDNIDFRFFSPDSSIVYFDFTNRRISKNVSFLTTEWYTIKCQNNSLTINGTVYSGTTATTTPANAPIYIFGNPIRGSVDFKLKYLKIFENTVLVKHLIAAVDASGTAGFYDIVNYKWYRSINSNAMIAYNQ